MLLDVVDVVNQELNIVFIISLCNKEKVICLKVFEQFYWVKDFVNIFFIIDINGVIFIVGDVVIVCDMFVDDSYYLLCYNGINGYGIQVFMDEYGDVIKMVQQVYEVVDVWYEKGLLFEGVEFEIWYDKSMFIIE